MSCSIVLVVRARLGRWTLVVRGSRSVLKLQWRNSSDSVIYVHAIVQECPTMHSVVTRGLRERQNTEGFRCVGKYTTWTSLLRHCKMDTP